MPACRGRAAMMPLLWLVAPTALGLAAGPAVTATFPASAVIEEVKTWSYESYTRVVVYADRKVTFRARELPADPANGKPPRIYVDLDGARLAPNVPAELPIGDGLLKRARIAQFDKSRVRAVLDLESLASFSVVSFVDPFRVVIDVRGHGSHAAFPPATPSIESGGHEADVLAELFAQPDSSAQAGSTASVVTRPTAVQPLHPRPVQPPPRITSPPARRVVVIDAGHGGKDPGAIGYKGLREKDVVLDVAMQVAARVRKQGHKVVLTRTDDRFLELPERTAIANGSRADLFVSIHANSAPARDAHGVETYHLAPPSDRRSREVAARENGVAGDESDALEELLGALRMSGRLNVSYVLAKFVQTSLSTTLGAKYSPYRDLGVKGAPFYVLVGTDMPAVLVEIGFITNPAEAKRLADKAYRMRLADAIAGGIAQYFAKAGTIPL